MQRTAETIVSDVIDETVGESANEAVSEVPRQRLRVVYCKGESIKFISHQDEFRMWERTLRRADLPLFYKQGFHPHPGMQFAAPLGVGFTGVLEYMDIFLSPPLPVVEIRERIQRRLAPGVTIVSLDEIPLRADALANTLIGADYTVILYATEQELARAEIEERILGFQTQTEVWRERERKGERYTYNLRPLIFELRYAGADADLEEQYIFVRVQQRHGATGRPDEVVAALSLDDHARTLRRDRMYFAANPDDATIFAAYPVIEQGSIAGARPERVNKQKAKAAPERRVDGRTIGERAGDEFV